MMEEGGGREGERMSIMGHCRDNFEVSVSLHGSYFYCSHGPGAHIGSNSHNPSYSSSYSGGRARPADGPTKSNTKSDCRTIFHKVRDLKNPV